MGAFQMASVNWKSGVSGNWNTAADWTGGAVPGSASDVIVGVAGSYTVTINASDAAHSLTINNATATVADDAGMLTLGTKLSVTAGSFALSNGGVVSGGTVAVGSGGTLLSSGSNDISSVLTNSGLLSIISGTLELDGGGAIGGTVSGAGTLDLTAGTFASTAAALAGTGGLFVNGGRLNVSGASGTIAAPFHLDYNGTLAVAAGTDATLSGSVEFGDSAADQPCRHRDLVRRSGSYRPEEQDHAALGEACRRFRPA